MNSREPIARASRPKLADQVVERIRRLIDDETYARGSRLPTETELSKRFNVGRSTVREAVRVLSHMGEVSVKHGDGTFVAACAPTEHFERRLARARIDDLYEARGIIEVQTASLAAQRRTRRDIDAMRRELRKRRRAQETGDAQAFLLADFAFHAAVAKGSKNEDYFDEKTKRTIVRGKTFDASNDYETDQCYGKMIFAREVVAPMYEDIDFSGFRPLLRNIVAAIQDYRNHIIE
ncbi:MAG TPA: GntR family transcriptional regulator [Candidatus Baltobacteraceae bacterium]|nr:GntR family transcriptional regulator [Candidatus Baltobacteraceae bacterium]